MTAFKSMPPAAPDSHEAAKIALDRFRAKRRRSRIKFIARIALIGLLPVVLPATAFFLSPVATFESAPSKPLSVEAPAYDNTPAETPEGLSTLRLRRER